jgi:hypothetical protein
MTYTWKMAFRLFRRRTGGSSGEARPSAPTTCELIGHDACAHQNAGVLPDDVVPLCSCDCHKSCPVTGRTGVSYTEKMRLCTCPGTEKVRGLQARSGIDLAEMWRLAEAVRERPPDPELGKEHVARALARLYEVAARDAGEPAGPGTWFKDTPQKAMDHAMLGLAAEKSSEEIMRLLNMTEAEVRKRMKAARRNIRRMR